MSESSDLTDHVTCTIKASVNLQIGDTKTEISQSGVSVVDINLPFGKTVNIEDITFKNYYCAFVSVRVLKRTPGQEAQWSTALRDLPLMDNPHTEAGSQDYYCIHRDQMLLVPDNVVSVRLILRQPSSAWLTFNLEDIKIHPHTQPAPVKEVSDWLSNLTLVDQHLNMEGLPDPQAVSSSIQQMWALTEVMQTNQTTASIGRFDVAMCAFVDIEEHRGVKGGGFPLKGGSAPSGSVSLPAAARVMSLVSGNPLSPALPQIIYSDEGATMAEVDPTNT